MSTERSDRIRDSGLETGSPDDESDGHTLAGTKDHHLRRYQAPRTDRPRPDGLGTDRPLDGRPLRIMVLDPVGSTSGYSHDLCNALAERGSDVHLHTSASWRTSSGPCATRKYRSHVAFPDPPDPTVPFGRIRVPFQRARARMAHLWALARLIPGTRRHDVVHCHRLPGGMMDVLWLWLIGRWTTVAFTVHEVLPRGRRGRWTRRAHRIAYRAADVLFVHCRATERELMKNFGVARRRIVRIHHGSTTHLADRRAREPACPIAHGDTPVVLFIGEVGEHDGVDVLLKAANHLRREVWSFKVVIAGKPDGDLTSLHALVRDLGLERLIEFRFGPVPLDEMQAYFSQATVIALPHRETDPSPTAVAACTFGKPIVASRVGGMAEMVEEADNGLLVPPDDPQGLASALADILRDDSLRRRLGSNSLIYAKTDLSWRRIAGESATAYRRVLADQH